MAGSQCKIERYIFNPQSTAKVIPGRAETRKNSPDNDGDHDYDSDADYNDDDDDDIVS